MASNRPQDVSSAILTFECNSLPVAMGTLLGSSNTPFTFVYHTLIGSQPETIVQHQAHLLSYTVLYFVQYYGNWHYHKDCILPIRTYNTPISFARHDDQLGPSHNS